MKVRLPKLIMFLLGLGFPAMLTAQDTSLTRTPWEAKLFFAPEHGSVHAMPQNPVLAPQIKRQFDSIYDARIGYVAGGTVRVRPANRFFLETGLLFSDRGFRIPKTNLQWEPGSTPQRPPEAFKIVFHHQYLSVPAWIGYRQPIGKLALSISAGGSYDRLVGLYQVSTVWYPNGRTITTREKPNFPNRYSKNDYNALAAASLCVPLRQKISLEIGIRYRYSSRVFYSNQSLLNYRLSGISAGVGLAYHWMTTSREKKEEILLDADETETQPPAQDSFLRKSSWAVGVQIMPSLMSWPNVFRNWLRELPTTYVPTLALQKRIAPWFWMQGGLSYMHINFHRYASASGWMWNQPGVFYTNSSYGDYVEASLLGKIYLSRSWRRFQIYLAPGVVGRTYRFHHKERFTNDRFVWSQDRVVGGIRPFLNGGIGLQQRFGRRVLVYVEPTIRYSSSIFDNPVEDYATLLGVGVGVMYKLEKAPFSGRKVRG